MFSKKIRVILQARTTSKRLPAKVLLPIGGVSLAVLCAKRLESTGLEVILATSNTKNDDLLVQIAEKNGITVFRGNLNNVLDRFVQCITDLEDTDIIVRTTADNPIPDGKFIELLIKKFHESDKFYYTINWPENGLPYGVAAEVMTVKALRNAAENTNSTYDCEHVTPWLRRLTDKNNLKSRENFLKEDYSQLRATVDTLEDYLFMASLFNEVEKPFIIRWDKIINKLQKFDSFDEIRFKSVKFEEKISRLTLGTAQFGMDYGVANLEGKPDDKNTAEILTRAVNSGVKSLDTARAYGDSERRIGKLLPESARESIKICTKLKPLNYLEENTKLEDVLNIIDASVLDSCRELGRKKIDILMFHSSDDMFRWNGAALSRLEKLKEKGIIQEIGVSVYTPQEAIKCLKDRRIKHIQIPFNILDSRWLTEKFLEKIASRPDVSVHVRSVLLQGLLVNHSDIWPKWLANRIEIVEKIDLITKKLSRKSKLDLCIAYIRSFKWVNSLVLAVETPKQLEEILICFNEPELKEEQILFISNYFKNVPERLLNPSCW